MVDGEALVESAKRERLAGRFQESADLYKQAADAFDSAGRPMLGAHAARHQAAVLLKAGDAAEASRRILTVLLFYKEREVPRLEMANTLRVAAMAQQGQGFLDEARKFWSEARELYAAEMVEAGVEECNQRLAELG